MTDRLLGPIEMDSVLLNDRNRITARAPTHTCSKGRSEQPDRKGWLLFVELNFGNEVLLHYQPTH